MSSNRERGIGTIRGIRKSTPTYPLPPPTVLGIDPGLSGAFCLTNGGDFCEIFPMPVEVKKGEKRLSFTGCLETLRKITKGQTVGYPTFLERAKPISMGSKFAFNYGRDFQTLVIALKLIGLAPILVEPSAWAKEMHQGIDPNLKPKAKSLIAAEKLPLVEKLPRGPRSGKLLDGPVDAFLIANYGLRELEEERKDF